MTDNIYPVIPIKYLVDQDGEPTMPHKLANSTKTSVSYPRILFFPCVVWKSTAHVGTKALNMNHQSQKYFGVSLLEFHNIKKCTSSTYLVQIK